MDSSTAIELLRPAVATAGGTWADMGAGRGVFTRALALLLGPRATVFALDRDADAVRALTSIRTSSRTPAARIEAMLGDLTDPPSLPPLDGILLANALHYVASARQADALVR